MEDLGVWRGSCAGYAPSGHVPGGVAGIGASRSLGSRGEDDGPDHVFLLLLRVLDAKCEDLSVIVPEVQFPHKTVHVTCPRNKQYYGPMQEKIHTEKKNHGRRSIIYCTPTRWWLLEAPSARVV